MSNQHADKRKAVALKYEGQGAPRVIAKGERYLAEQIIALARQAGVPIMQDPALVQLLSQVELDAEIPPELYQAVATLLAFVYRMEQKVSGSADKTADTPDTSPASAGPKS
ncbi:MAG TPA: type III secretion protein [Sulfurivirga caldicuralii]|nr:type III secretion protein [Sulfurivirga caldicuralii]